MKSTAQFKRWQGALVAVLLLTLAVVHASPPAFEIQTGIIGSGGGTSSGGDFRVTGTIGEIAPGHSVGGAFELESGFFAMFMAVQVEGAPMLMLTQAGENVVLSWPVTAIGFDLEKTGDVANVSSWGSAGGTVVVLGDNFQVSFPMTGSSQFFRLKKAVQ